MTSQNACQRRRVRDCARARSARRASSLAARATWRTPASTRSRTSAPPPCWTEQLVCAAQKCCPALKQRKSVSFHFEVKNSRFCVKIVIRIIFLMILEDDFLTVLHLKGYKIKYIFDVFVYCTFKHELRRPGAESFATCINTTLFNS